MSNYRGKKNHFSKSFQYNVIGANINSINYFGDLAPKPSIISTNLGLTRPAIGLSYGHRFGPFYSLNADFRYGTINGDDFKSADPLDPSAKFRYVRNLQFRNRIKEFSVVGTFDLYKNEYSYVVRKLFTPYAYIGVAMFHHNPQAKVNANSTLPEAGQWVDLRPLGTEGQYSNLPDTAVNFGIKPYSKIQVSIPFGIGVRFKLTDVFDLSIESGFRYLFTDYIDDVSGNYVDLVHLNSDLARELSDRSREATSAITGEARNQEVINATVSTPQGILLPAPGGYETYGGYGREYKQNYRGFSNNKDMLIVTTIKLTFVLEGSFQKAKFR